MMNEQILNNYKEDFVLKYRAAVKAKISREQLAEFLGMQTKSLMRRKQELFKDLGLNLPSLGFSDKPFSIVEDHYLSILNEMATVTKKIEILNSNQKTVINIKHNKRYIITSAQNATPIHKGFLGALEKYCEYNDAELLVIPYRYKNPTSVWSVNGQTDDWWDNSIEKYLIQEELKLGNHIRVMGQIKIQPTATSPLSGFDTVSELDSAIFGHPRIEWKTIPAIGKDYPKILTTTGSITTMNYTDSKAGHKGAMHHTFGAIVLEIADDGLFHLRHITGNEVTGAFYDLDKLYSSKDVKEDQRILALCAGDTHAEVIDEDVMNALYMNDDSMAEALKPKYMIFNDILDQKSRNHHIKRDGLGRFKRHYFSENDNVEEGLQKVADFLDRVSKPFAENIVVRSNHDEHLSRWIAEADPLTDPENARFYHYLRYHQYKAIQDQQEGFDVLKFWMTNPDQYFGMKNTQTTFLGRNDSFELAGVELSQHGDIGANGAKGTIGGFSRLGKKMVVGHSHTPGIVGNAYQTGTSTPRKLDYTTGASSWLNTHAIIYEDGSIALITVIDGKWKI